MCRPFGKLCGFWGLMLLGVWPAPPAVAQDISECLVQASDIARVGAASRGVIAHVLAERAQRVAQNDILAELEASEEEAEVDLARLRVQSDIAVRLARARAETAELNAERQIQLVERDLIPISDQEAAMLEARTAQLEVEDAMYQLEVARVQLEAALSARERKRVRAPFDGVVTETLVSEGEIYNEQTPIVVVARVDPLHVEAYLSARKRAGIVEGQVARVTVETGGSFAATVAVIDPVLDAATGTFGLRLTLPNPDGAILAGQSCTLDLRSSN